MGEGTKGPRRRAAERLELLVIFNYNELPDQMPNQNQANAHLNLQAKQSQIPMTTYYKPSQSNCQADLFLAHSKPTWWPLPYIYISCSGEADPTVNSHNKKLLSEGTVDKTITLLCLVKPFLAGNQLYEL